MGVCGFVCSSTTHTHANYFSILTVVDKRKTESWASADLRGEERIRFPWDLVWLKLVGLLIARDCKQQGLLFSFFFLGFILIFIVEKSDLLL